MIILILNVLDGTRVFADDCHFLIHSLYGYTCQLSNVSYLNDSEAFPIGGNHVEGYTDNDVLVVETTGSSIMMYIPKELVKFVNLEQLLLSQSFVKSIDGAFQECEKLNTMMFYKNKLTNLASRNLEKCTNLRSLDFRQNEITVIAVDAFEGLTLLESLDLDYNPVKAIFPATFDGLTNLQYLFLRDLKVPELHQQWFTNLKKLQRFNFGTSFDQSVMRISTGTFKSMPALEIISISDCKSQEMILEPMAFDNLEKLQQLILTGDGIQRLNANSFTGVDNLVSLNIDNNAISAIEKTFFDNFPKLKEINANNNVCVARSFYIDSPLNEVFQSALEECFNQWELTESSTIDSTTETTEASVPSTTDDSTITTPFTTEPTTMGSSSIIPNFFTRIIIGLLIVYMIVGHNL